MLTKTQLQRLIKVFGYQRAMFILRILFPQGFVVEERELWKT